jgi:NhaP-type Na+/H+ or K+/H+ antiporter
VIWATLGAIVVGTLAGAADGATGLEAARGRSRSTTIMDDLVGLGMIAVVYGTASVIKASGFLAVFFAAVALRQAS